MPFKKIEDGTDDTEGNMPRVRIAKDGVQDDDTEGHGIRGKGGVEDGVEDDDTEGNRRHLRSASDGVEDDTDGSAFKWRGVEDGVDDTDGNIVRPGRTIPPAANPGKAIKPRG